MRPFLFARIFSSFHLSLLLTAGFMLTGCASSQKKIEERKAEIHYAQGTSALMEKDYTQALQSFLQAYQITPTNPDLLNNLSMAYYFKEQYGLCEEFLLKALKLKPDHSDARSNLGALYMKRGDFDKAEEEFLKVTKDLVYEKQFRVTYNLGLIYLSRNNPEKAKTYFHESIVNKEDHCPAHFQLGKIAMDEQKYAEGLTAFKEASKGICYNDPTPLYYQAVAYMKLNKFERARDILADVVKRFPQNQYAILGKDKLNEIKSFLPELPIEQESSAGAEDEEHGDVKTSRLSKKKDEMNIDKVLADEGLSETISQ